MNGAQEELDDLGEKVQQIKALVLRMAELSHYRAFADIDFIIKAVGEKDYDGSPALDVLPSHEDIDRDLREKVKEYIYCLTSWVEEKDLEDAVAEFKADERFLRNTYMQLGELDEEKKSLATFLAENLQEKVASPEDIVSEISNEDFIVYAYKTILGRAPDDDDFKLKMIELNRGKTRQELIKDILKSRESHKRMMTEIADSIIKQSTES